MIDSQQIIDIITWVNEKIDKFSDNSGCADYWYGYVFSMEEVKKKLEDLIKPIENDN